MTGVIEARPNIVIRRKALVYMAGAKAPPKISSCGRLILYRRK